MIYYNQVGRLRRLAGTEEGAGAASARQAGFGCAAFVFCPKGASRTSRSYGPLRLISERSAAASLMEPDQHLSQHPDFFSRLRSRGGASNREPVRTEVIAATLEHCGTQIQVKRAFQIGNVLLIS